MFVKVKVTSSSYITFSGLINKCFIQGVHLFKELRHNVDLYMKRVVTFVGVKAFVSRAPPSVLVIKRIYFIRDVSLKELAGLTKASSTYCHKMSISVLISLSSRAAVLTSWQLSCRFLSWVGVKHTHRTLLATVLYTVDHWVTLYTAMLCCIHPG